MVTRVTRPIGSEFERDGFAFHAERGMKSNPMAGRFAPVLKISGPSLAAAVIGGLLLGYGARIAYGCNIGAYFSGISSGSLHGWLWLVAAFSGNIAGTRLRPMFDLPVERTRAAC